MPAAGAQETLFLPGRDLRQKIPDYIMDEANNLRYLLNREPAVWIKKAIMPHLHKSGWKHVLKEPSYKFHGIKAHGFPFLLSVILI